MKYRDQCSSISRYFVASRVDSGQSSLLCQNTPESRTCEVQGDSSAMQFGASKFS